MATVKNTNLLTFGVAAANHSNAISWASVWHGSTRLAKVQLTGTAQTPQLGQEVQLPAEGLTFSVQPSASNGMDDAGIVDMINDFWAGQATEVRLHTGDPGTANSNLVAETNYANASVAAGAWTIATGT